MSVLFRKSNLLVGIAIVILCCANLYGFNECLTSVEAEKVIETIRKPVRAKKNKKVKREPIGMREKRERLNREAFSRPENSEAITKRANKLNRTNLIRICSILKASGWLTKKQVGREGIEAALYLIRNSDELKIQDELFPVLVEATQKGRISKANLAALIDKRRIANRGKQIFGTQIKIRDEIGYLYPLENQAKVDQWRKIYELPTLSKFIKLIEIEYRTVVVKMPLPPQLKSLKRANANSGNIDPDALGLSDDDEILNIDSGLVNLNLRVFDRNLIGTRGLELSKNDFEVYEIGVLQQISFFSTKDTPFDLVLLLDLSGSTRQKQHIIAESASRFIKLVRPKDRVAIVTFTDRVTIISNYTSDKEKLLEKLLDVNDFGSSRVWDALEFTYRKIVKNQSNGRRSAIVFMTDGVDNTLMQNRRSQRAGSYVYWSRPSNATFTELLETTRRYDTTLFSIYVDTEIAYSGAHANAKSYRQARKTLKFLAEETGGQYYRATMLEDLSGIYEKIVNDLSEVYSVGYESSAENRDGSWREVKVKVKGRPDLTVKNKSGYYAR